MHKILKFNKDKKKRSKSIYKKDQAAKEQEAAEKKRTGSAFLGNLDDLAEDRFHCNSHDEQGSDSSSDSSGDEAFSFDKTPLVNINDSNKRSSSMSKLDLKGALIKEHDK